MSRRKPAPRYKPRKRLNLSDETVVAYLLQFEVKLPEGVGPPGAAYARRESPPTLDEREALDAYRDLLTKADQIGVRNPRLIERTVTDRVLRDRAAELAARNLEAVAEHASEPAP